MSFGLAAEDVTLVDWTGLLTPAASEGVSTDSYPTQDGNHIVMLEGIQANDLTCANLNADSRNSVDEDSNALPTQLAALGMDIG